MTFSSPRTNLFVSDEGYSVEVLGITSIEYLDAEHRVRMDVELAATEPLVRIFRSSIGRGSQPPTNDEAFVDQVIARVKAAITWSGHEVAVVDSSRPFPLIPPGD